VWSLQDGDERPQHPMKLGTDPRGNLFIAGFDDLYVENRTVLDAENSILARLNPSAPEQRWWWRSTSTFNPDRTTGMAVSDTGDELYVSGFKHFEDEEGVGGGIVRRLDPDGQQRWITRVGFAATEVDELLIAPNGKLFAAGSTMLSIGGPNQGAADAYIALLDRQTGELRWVVNAGTSEHDVVTALAVGPSGDLYVAGETEGSFPGQTHQGGRDLFVLRFDASGNLRGAWQRGTAGDEHAGGIWVDSCHNVFLTGYTEGALIEGQAPAGGRDMFLMKVPMPE